MQFVICKYFNTESLLGTRGSSSKTDRHLSCEKARICPKYESKLLNHWSMHGIRKIRDRQPRHAMTPAQIKALREKLGLTQPEFFDRLGMKSTSIRSKRQTISRWESGERHPGQAASALLAMLEKKTGK
jgi:DNA-binding transcriptional regulator YiaG